MAKTYETEAEMYGYDGPNDPEWLALLASAAARPETKDAITAKYEGHPEDATVDEIHEHYHPSAPEPN